MIAEEDIGRKEVLSVRVDTGIKRRFKTICMLRGYSISAVIEQYMAEFVQEGIKRGDIVG